jgi:ADP-ribosyl-[dinitrogen reductase] hydrolase
VYDAARGVSLQRAIDLATDPLRKEKGCGEVMAAIEHACRLANAGVRGAADIESLGRGFVGEEALAIALACALTADTSTPVGVNRALWLAVAHSGDSDSTGAITGNILGAAAGVEALDEAWLARLEMRDLIARVARDLYAASIEGRELDAAQYPPD